MASAQVGFQVLAFAAPEWFSKEIISSESIRGK